MQIHTEDDFSGVLPDHDWAAQFTVLGYQEGGRTLIPHGFFRDWRDLEPDFGHFYIGRCSGLGVGSEVKYDSNEQGLSIGRFVAGGSRLRFVLNGQHETRTISTYMFSIAGTGMLNPPPPQYGDTVVKNDVWIGDEAMILGGSIIENGCVIGARTVVPPNFHTEPYGIYVGSPARLVRFRFSEKVRAALIELAWWEMPLDWIQANNVAFLQDMTADEAQALDIIAGLRASRKAYEALPLATGAAAPKS